jgi:hypothetical protein
MVNLKDWLTCGRLTRWLILGMVNWKAGTDRGGVDTLVGSSHVEDDNKLKNER